MRLSDRPGRVFVCITSLLVACGGQTNVPEQAPGGGQAPAPPAATAPAPAPTPEVPPIAWKACSAITGESGGGAECATIEVPLDWNDVEGKKAELFVKRIVGSGSPRKQVWLLQGGPGGAGDGMEEMALELAAQDKSFDVYIPDHRGTGRSTYLGCKAQQLGLYSLDAWQTCINEVKQTWGDKLATFSTTTAARDLGYAIQRTRAPGQDVHVYGVSYGTYWAQRYLQIFPAQPTTVVLDGVCQSGLCSLSRYGKWFDDVGKKYLGDCANDAFCASKLGHDPVAKVNEAFAKLDARSCPGITAGWDGSVMRQVFAMFVASFQMRALVPSTTHRILRCSAEDVTAVNHMIQTLQQWLSGGRRAWANGDDLSSDVLGMNIALSELEEQPVIAKAELLRLMSDAVFFEKDDTHTRDLYDIWPRYPHDQFVGGYPQSNVPVLLLNGTLDPQTPVEFAQAVAPHYTQPHSRLVELPRAAHGTVYQSPTVNRGRACGWTLMTSFMGGPAALDTSCTSKILPHDFESGGQLANVMYGTSSLWGLSPRRLPSFAEADAQLSASLERDVKRAARITHLPLRLP
jgi:pimeloyl-ACP methyl ester carboxylesterase